MKTKGDSADKLVKVPQKVLLALVADKLQDRVLFPKKLEEAKAYMKKVRVSHL